jgi:hypothetical protein
VSDLSRTDRIIGALVLGLLLALLGFGLAEQPAPSHPAASAVVAPHATTPPTASATGPVAGPVTAVGDSVLLDAMPYLQADLPGVRVEAEVNLQFDGGVQMVQQDRSNGTLGNVLVVELGTNGPVTAAELDQMLSAAAGVKRVVFVNLDEPRSWVASDNAVLAAGVAAHPGLCVLADWDALSSGHPEWFASDQVHLEPVGAKAFADLVAHDA